MTEWIAGNVWILGACLIGIVLVHSLVSLYGTVRRNANLRRLHDRERELLEQRIAAARIHRIDREQEALAWTGFRKFEVQRKVDEGGDICSFYLVPHDRKQLPGFRPGQYLTFRLNIPGQAKPVIRCYSLSESPRSDYYRVSIKRVPPPRNKPEAPPGLSSNYFHDHVKEGDILDVKAPSGQFFLDLARDNPIVLIGGGVGLTPVLSMMNSIIDIGSKREAWFFYGVRNGREHILVDHMNRIAREHEHINLNVCYSEPGESDQIGENFQHKGWVSVDLFKQLLPSNNYEFFICGPPPMMESLTRDLEAWGVPKEHINFEAFGPATVKKAAPPRDADEKAIASSIEVTFSRSGKTINWDVRFDSLLDFAEEHDILIDSGCRAGNCGTCLTAIKSGEVEYSAETGAEPEEGSCLACVCRPKGNLVVDA